MPQSGDGKNLPTFSTWDIYPRVQDYDRAWHIDGIAMIRLIEESMFWVFLGWVDEGMWPSLLDAKVSYPQRISSVDLPLRIDGWLLNDPHGAISYEVRPESAPDSDPMFTAVLRYQPFEIALPAQQAMGLQFTDASHSLSGSLPQLIPRTSS
jgi:hypothetical protein